MAFEATRYAPVKNLVFKSTPLYRCCREEIFPPLAHVLLELKVLDKLEQVTRPRGPQDPFKQRDDISQELVNLTSNKMPPFGLKV